MLVSLHDFLEIGHDLARPRLQLLTSLVPCTVGVSSEECRDCLSSFESVFCTDVQTGVLAF